MSDLISRSKLLEVLDEDISNSKECRNDAKIRANDGELHYFNGEIVEARRIKRYVNMWAAPIDAAPIVRCKDCKHRGSPYNCPMRNLVMPFSGAGSYADCTEDDGYCHKGERRDGGAG